MSYYCSVCGNDVEAAAYCGKCGLCTRHCICSSARFNWFLVALFVVGLPIAIFGQRVLDTVCGPSVIDPARDNALAAIVVGGALLLAVGVLVLRMLCDLEDLNARKGAKP